MSAFTHAALVVLAGDVLPHPPIVLAAAEVAARAEALDVPDHPSEDGSLADYAAALEALVGEGLVERAGPAADGSPRYLLTSAGIAALHEAGAVHAEG